MAKRTIDRYWLEERIAIRTEQIPRPTQKQLHDALNATIVDLKQVYGDIEIVQWPTDPPSGTAR